MKNIFKLIILITITLNFAACEQEKNNIYTMQNKKHPKSVMEPLYWDGKKLFPYFDQDLESAVKRAYDEAISLYEENKFEEAIKYLEFSDYILPTGKNSDQACTVYSAKGDFKEAIKWCKQAVDLGYEESITGLGLVYARDKDYENALVWLKKGDELNQPKASTGIGFVYNELANKSNLNKEYLKKAEEYYLKAIKNYPKDIRNVSNIIHFYHDDLKDNVKASAWAIAGINNIFLANSVADLLIVDFQIPLEDIQKGHQLQLTSDEFPYNYSENNLAMIKKSGYESWLRMYKEDKQREQETIKYEEAQRKIAKEFNERVQRDIEEKEKQQKENER